MESCTVEPISYADLATGATDACTDFCARVHSHGYAVLRYPPEAVAEVAALRADSADFFALPVDQKRSIGDFRFVGDTYAGYRDSECIDAEFLEVHTTADGGTFPPLRVPEGMSHAAAALHRRLDGMARVLLRVLAAHLRVDAAAFLAPLDPCPSPAADSGEGSLSASVLRVCHYRAGSSTSAAEEGERGGVDVLFDTHTDSSLLTLSTLCPGAPGLQLQDEGEWLSIEEVPGVSESDVEVHVGDFLSFITRDYFPSCVHRVTRPRGSAAATGRLSFPFLVRLLTLPIARTLAGP